MSEDRMIKVEEVASVEAPPKARGEDVETAPEKLERKRDYLEGFLAAKPAAVEPGAVGGDLYEAVINALKDIYDPEIPVNIYDLGLIYDVLVDADRQVGIRMTLTAPACPAAQTLPGEVREAAKRVEGVSSARVEIVFDPPWAMDRMTEAAKLQLGLL